MSSAITPQPSIAWAEVEEALIEWARDTTGIEAIWMEDGGTQPTRPYVALDWLVPPSRMGDDYYSDTAVTATQELERVLDGVREATLTVQVFTDSKLAGSNAMYFCDILANSVFSPTIVQERFAPVRMAPWGVEPIRKGAFAEDAKAISRAAFDMRLGFAAGTGEPAEIVPYIVSTSITGTVTNQSDEIAVTASVTS